MRTGAVAALSVEYFMKEDAKVISMMGLGQIAKATFKCLMSLDALANHPLKIRLLRYKDQAERFAQEFENYSNVEFEIVQTPQELVDGADVIISAVTYAQELICPQNELYKKGVTLIPVHTRGFQNCDLFFDKVFVDDIGHVKGFKYFNQFKQVEEFSNVILANARGRESNEERVLCYNIGLGLHDAYYATRIFEILTE